MNSTPDPKEIKPHDALIAGADEGLAHAHEQIKRADEQLTRLTEQLARMERDDAHPPSARPGSQGLARKDLARTNLARTNLARNLHRRKAGAPDHRRPVPGGVHHCRCPSGFAVILWRRAHADCRPLGAAARFNAIIVAGKSAVPRATRSIYLPGGRGGVSASASNATASNNLGSGRTARRRAGSTRSASRSNAVAANDRARSRESGANHRTAQGEPAASRQREFKSHWGAQGDPGRDETRAREGFRAEPAQDGTASVTASDAAGPGLAQARADG